jgi:uncharacterized protein
VTEEVVDVARTRTYVVDMHPNDCAQLLASSSLGRLGVIVAGRPEIFPVNHVYDHDKGCVAFPTNDGTKLRAALDWPWVAYEVDGVAADGEAGWSVLVVGRAEEITDEAEIARLEGRRRVTWRAGAGVTWLRIVPAKMSGRRICASSTGVTISWATDTPPLAPLTH